MADLHSIVIGVLRIILYGLAGAFSFSLLVRMAASAWFEERAKHPRHEYINIDYEGVLRVLREIVKGESSGQK